MKEKLIEILGNTLQGIEVYEQGSITDDENYPERFFTYWNDDTEEKAYYDNKAHVCVWYFTINFYSTNPLETTEMILKAKEALGRNGWIVEGKGRDIYSDSQAHSGRSIETIYMEKEEKKDV